jgi:hypothetical protein
LRRYTTVIATLLERGALPDGENDKVGWCRLNPA